MKLGLKGRVAVITGSGSGIGKAIALALAREGVKVVIGEIDTQKGVKVAEEIRKRGGQSLACATDVSRRDEVRQLIEKAMKEFGRVDILVNNAGICPLTPFEDIKEEEWDKVLNINLKGAFNCSQCAIKFMKKQKFGRIINIGSIAGKDGGVVGFHYSASKAGIICLTKSLAKYGAPYRINVNTVSPGPIDTEMTKNWPVSTKKTRLKQIPLGMFGQPEDIAETVVFLASDLARYITGENIDVNGGALMD